MKAVTLIMTLALGVLVTPLAIRAQQPMNLHRIGLVTAGGDRDSWPLEIDTMPRGFPKALRQGLRELGYLEGHTILIEYRGAGGHLDRIPGLVADLVRLPVDVLVSSNGPAIRAAKAATRTIPVVMAIKADPAAMGLIESSARPGGNLTGLTTLNRRLSGKRLEVLTEVVPGLAHVGILGDGNESGWRGVFQQYEEAARALKIPLRAVEVRGPHPDLEEALQAAAQEGVRALIALRHSALSRHQQRLADLALQHRLPLMSEDRAVVDVGDLLSYTSSDAANGRRAAYFVDRILKGAKPAELPVEEPTTFELVINLQTAQALSLTISPTLLFQATEVLR